MSCTFKTIIKGIVVDTIYDCSRQTLLSQLQFKQIFIPGLIIHDQSYCHGQFFTGKLCILIPKIAQRYIIFVYFPELTAYIVKRVTEKFLQD